jgi:hypothetical protein
MQGFTPFGIFFLFTSVLFGVACFMYMRDHFKIPWYYNLVGALMVFVGSFLTQVWVIFQLHVFTGTDLPKVHFYNGLGGFLMAICWYSLYWTVPKFFGMKPKE